MVRDDDARDHYVAELAGLATLPSASRQSRGLLRGGRVKLSDSSLKNFTHAALQIPQKRRLPPARR
jgi:hypothetical protein